MLADSRDAIRSLLKSTFPGVTRTYLNSVPDKFQRPSFFIDLATSGDEHLNRAMYQGRATWQIVYFAPLEEVGNPDRLDQHSVSDTLKRKLMDNMTLTGPGGTVYHILDCEGGPRDAEAYITVRLEAEFTREQETFDTIQDIEHVQKMGDVEID